MWGSLDGEIDPHFPILLLAFVLVEKDRYSSEIIPAIGRLKTTVLAA
jgi:hypothetical protein